MITTTCLILWMPLASGCCEAGAQADASSCAPRSADSSDRIPPPAIARDYTLEAAPVSACASCGRNTWIGPAATAGFQQPEEAIEVVPAGTGRDRPGGWRGLAAG